jgi:hypothetical protein
LVVPPLVTLGSALSSFQFKHIHPNSELGPVPSPWQNSISTLADHLLAELPTSKSLIMGLGDDFKDLENDATGQGGNDGDNNANNA